MADDLGVFQELLDAEVLVEALGFPVNASKAVAAIKELRRLAPSQDAAAVAKAWERLSGAIGPKLTAALLSSADWPRLCPLRGPLDNYDSGDHHQVVWLGEHQKVVATAVMDGGALLGVRFTVEPR